MGSARAGPAAPRPGGAAAGGSHLAELGRDLLAYGLMSGLAQMGGLLLLPLLTRAFSVGEYGAVDVVATFVALLALAVQLALPNALARHWAESAGAGEREGLIASLLLCIGGCGLFVLLALAFLAEPLARLLLGPYAEPGFLQLGGAIATFAALATIPSTVLRMERRIVAYNAVQLVATTLSVLLAIAFVYGLGSGIRGVFVAQLAGAAASLALGLVLVRSRLAARASGRALRGALAFSLPMLPGTLAAWANAQLDRLLLLVFAGLGGVGVFGAAARIASLLGFLLLVFRQAWAPYAMLLLEDPARDAIYRRMLRVYAGGFAAAGLALCAAAPELFAWLVPQEYLAGLVALPWLVGAAVLHHSAAFTTLGVLVSERTAGISWASAAGIGINLGFGLLLIPRWGIAGAAVGSFLAELAYTGLMWRVSLRSSSVRFDTRAALETLGVYVAGSLALLAAVGRLEGSASAAVRAAIVLAAAAWIARRLWRERGG